MTWLTCLTIPRSVSSGPLVKQTLYVLVVEATRLFKNSLKLHKCKHLFALPGAGTVSIDVVMVIISC